MRNADFGIWSYRMRIADSGLRNKIRSFAFTLFIGAVLLIGPGRTVAADEALNLQALIDEALKNNPELRATESRWKAATYRITQAESLPDPMVMVGYQNEGWSKYTFGQMSDSQWMYSVSQMFPFPGKRSLKGEMASGEAGSLEALYRAARLKTISAIKSLYYDLFLAYKNIDIINERTNLFSRIEDAALSRYSAGVGSQQEVLMAQTEKYMLLEKETMLKQKIISLEAMLNNAVGRDARAPVSRPLAPAQTPFIHSLDDVLKLASENSPEIKSKEKMRASSQAQISMAKREFYPDLTLAGSVFKRTGPFEDMWSLTATINIPLYFNKKNAAVAEAKSVFYGAESELEATKLMLASIIRDNYSMLTTSEKLMGLYQSGLIPKTYQDFEQALTGYRAGKVEALTVINRLKTLLDFETLYWGQYVEREKAVARMEALAGITDSGPVEKKQ